VVKSRRKPIRVTPKARFNGRSEGPQWRPSSPRDLMVRMGHGSVHAALIYQHATSEAGRTIASAMDLQMRAARAGGGCRPGGRQVEWNGRRQ
jgi:hypothetical protein